MTFFTVNPANNAGLQEYHFMTKQEVQDILALSAAAQQQWKHTPVHERALLFIKLAQVLRDNNERYASGITQEMGKPIKESLAEIEKCAWLAEFYATHAVEWLADKHVIADGKKHVITFEPLGLLFLIMPWNFPFWQPMKVAMGPLIAGNGIMLKHARNVSGSALAVEEAFRKAGFPEHLFRTVIIDHDLMPDILASEYIQGASLTGSERAGAAFASVAGANLKKVVMELGGSDPCIICEDADLLAAAKGVVKARMMNAGQVCISAKRLFVHESIKEAFAALFVQEVAALKVGDPMDPQTDIGPLVDTRAVESMERFIDDAKKRGAQVLFGNDHAGMGGAYFPPTVLDNVSEDMQVSCQEVFGPIAPLMTFRTDEQAIALANATPYGLSASIWTSDSDRAERLARQIESGSVFINSLSKTDPRLPVGGIKRSGFGRELSEYGIREFVNIKTINLY